MRTDSYRLTTDDFDLNFYFYNIFVERDEEMQYLNHNLLFLLICDVTSWETILHLV